MPKRRVNRNKEGEWNRVVETLVRLSRPDRESNFCAVDERIRIFFQGFYLKMNADNLAPITTSSRINAALQFLDAPKTT